VAKAGTSTTVAARKLEPQIRSEFLNALNHAQFEVPNGNAGAGANFGRISAARAPRLIQFAGKLVW
jgi:hypothetical protein